MLAAAAGWLAAEQKQLIFAVVDGHQLAGDVGDSRECVFSGVVFKVLVGVFFTEEHFLVFGSRRRKQRRDFVRILNLAQGLVVIGGTLEVSTLRRAKGLEVLLLGGNAIGGSVPPGVGALRALRTLGLEGNALEGSLPSSLADISGLQQLRVQGNAGLCGVVPKDVMKRLGVANRVDTAGTGLGEPCVSDSKEEL